MFDPVDTLPDRDVIQYVANALANEGFDVRELTRRDGRLDRFALHVMDWRILRDEHRRVEIIRRVSDHDALLR